MFPILDRKKVSCRFVLSAVSCSWPNNFGMRNFTYLESLCSLQTTYMNPGIVSDESSPCATIHWDFSWVWFHAYAAKHQVTCRDWVVSSCWLRPCPLYTPPEVMMNRNSWGHSYLTVRGDILGFVKDDLLRKNLPKMRKDHSSTISHFRWHAVVSFG